VDVHSKRLAARAIIACVGLVCVGSSMAPASTQGVSKRFTAVAFDYLVLFNPDSIVSAVDQVAPGKGWDFIALWRARQFEYCWLRSMTDRYVDFDRITEDALTYTAKTMHVAVAESQKRALLDAYRHLAPWPDTARALARLRQLDVRIITIANFSPAMLRSNAEHAGLMSLFDALISTDANRSFKPDRRAYQLGVDYLGVPADNIVFAAFGGWDAAGAKSFGYPTVWVNRLHQEPEELGVQPDRIVPDLDGLLEFMKGAPADQSQVN
jgi:2-haloacid dehalogenase